MGLFDQLKEDLRAADSASVLRDIGVARLGNDDRYWKENSYAFHLHIGAVTKVFPLVLNPKRISKSHPFSRSLEPAQQGGVIAEENGVLISPLTVSGHTGLKPRAVTPGPPLPLSGQAHFLYLQDACFLEYSRLKKDPNTSKPVWMSWHNFKDNEHWVVVPGVVSVERTVDKNFLYQYTITCDLIAEIEQSLEVSEDEGIFAAALDFASNAIRAVAAIEGAVADLTGTITEIEGAISGTVTDALVDVVEVCGAVNLFLSGQSNFINLPVRALDTLATAIGTLQSACASAESLPIDVAHSFLDIEDGLLRLMSYPEKFRSDFDAKQKEFLALVAGPTNASDIGTATASTQTQGLATSATRPGDSTRVLGGVYDSLLSFPRYTGFREVVVLQGDSLAAIAAREMGDARRWIDIALANHLQAPYISAAGLPGTIGAGARVLIPITSSSPSTPRVRSAGDPEVGASQLEALFGRDFKMVVRPDGLYDWQIDPATKTDLRTVAGVKNLEQACTTALNIERGKWVMATNVGVERIVGAPGTVERVVEARSRIIEAVQRDQRIRRVKNATFQLEKDALAFDLEVESTDASNVRVIAQATS